MKEQFVTYEIALKLKELGFNEHCFCFYTYKKEIRRYTNFDDDLNQLQSIKNSSITVGDEWCSAPLWQQIIPFINNLLLKSGYEKYSDCYIRADFFNLKQLEDDILSSIELITPKQ